MPTKSSSLVFKIVESVCLVLGPTILALNLFSFKSDRSGIYFVAINEWGIAIGVMFISLAFVAKRWQ